MLVSLSPCVCEETGSAPILADLGTGEVTEPMLMASVVKAVTTGGVTVCDSGWVGAERRSAPELVAHMVDTTASVEG